MTTSDLVFALEPSFESRFRIRVAPSFSRHCLNLHTSEKFYIQCTGSHFNCNVHQYSLDGNISTESFPFLPEIFFVKDCIEEITRFVAAVK